METWVGMTQARFVDLIAEAFRRYGYTVYREFQASGYQMRIQDETENSLVRCKSWNAHREIDEFEIIELHGDMINQGLKTGWFISFSDYTFRAHNYAHNNKIALIDAEGVRTLLRECGMSIE